MQLLSRMNTKMDKGYKMTTFSCSFCSGVTLALPNVNNQQGKIYCPKCDKQYIPEYDSVDDGVVDALQQQEEEYNRIIQEQNKAVKQSNQKISNPSQPIQISQATTQNNKVKVQQKQQQQQQQQQNEDKIEEQYNRFLSLYNNTIKTPQQLKSQQTSKKIGQKLVNGWAMLQQACLECNVPLMKSKKGEMICCGCDKDYAQLRNNKNNNNMKNIGNKQVKNKPAQKQKQIQIQQKQRLNNKSSATNKIPLQHDNKNDEINSQQNRRNIKHEQNNLPENQQYNTKNQAPSIAYQKINIICVKTLQYLQKRLEQAFSMNDLETVQKILKTVKATKQML